MTHMPMSVEHALGLIQGELRGQTQQLAELIRSSAETRAETAEALRRLEAQDRRIAELEEWITSAASTLSEVGKWKERWRGAVMLGALVMAAIGGTIAKFWAVIMDRLFGGGS